MTAGLGNIGYDPDTGQIVSGGVTDTTPVVNSQSTTQPFVGYNPDVASMTNYYVPPGGIISPTTAVTTSILSISPLFLIGGALLLSVVLAKR